MDHEQWFQCTEVSINLIVELLSTSWQCSLHSSFKLSIVIIVQTAIPPVIIRSMTACESHCYCTIHPRSCVLQQRVIEDIYSMIL